MRIRKSKGKRKDTGEWIYGYYSYEPCGNKHYILVPDKNGILFDYDHIGAYEVIPESVGEFTELADMLKAEAYENDIIKCTEDCNIIGVIKYGKYKGPCEDKETSHIGFYVDWIEKTVRDTFRNELGYWLKCSKIIGNTTDNSELLNSKEG